MGDCLGVFVVDAERVWWHLPADGASWLCDLGDGEVARTDDEQRFIEDGRACQLRCLDGGCLLRFAANHGHY